MKRIVPYVVLVLIPAVCIAQKVPIPDATCQTCPGGDGTTEYVYGYSTTTALYGNGNSNSTIVIYLAGIGYTTRTVAFDSSGPSTAPTVAGYRIVPFLDASGNPGLFLYSGGIYVMTVMGNNPAQIAAFKSWILAQQAANPSWWQAHNNWITDLYWAAKAGWASDACNNATLEALAAYLAFWTSIFAWGASGGTTTFVSVGGTTIGLLTAMKRQAGACPY